MKSGKANNVFTTGFSKTAARGNPTSLAYNVERLLNRPVGALKSRGMGIRKRLSQMHADLVAGGKAGREPTRFGPAGGVKKNPGAALTEKRFAKATAGKELGETEEHQMRAQLRQRTKEDIEKRRGSLSEQKEKTKRGPSFAMRHPFITAGGTLYGAKKVLGDKNDQDGAYGAQPMVPGAY